MPDKFIGRRGPNEEEWQWLPVPVEQPNWDFSARKFRRSMLLAAIGASLLVLGVALLAAFADNSARDRHLPPSARPDTASAARGSSTTTASVKPPATDIEVTPSRSPPPIGDVQFFVWHRQNQQWLDSNNSKDEPGYAEDEAAPFLLKLSGAATRAVYDVTIEYQCRTLSGAAFDQIAGVSDEKDGAGYLTSPGPVRREDASILVPDDPSIAFDQPGRRFRLWDANFEGVAEGPLPTGPCESTKRVRLSLRAQGPTVFLIWGGHLASQGDWGQGQGASSQVAPIYMAVSVSGSEMKKLEVGADAITP